MTRQTLVQAIAAAADARRSCEKKGNDEWFKRWTERLEELGEQLPSGGGIDHGTAIDVERTALAGGAVVLATAYHHMNDNGFYDGWTEHVITVRPLFDGLDVRVSGRNRNDIKDYLGDVFHEALQEPACEW